MGFEPAGPFTTTRKLHASLARRSSLERRRVSAAGLSGVNYVKIMGTDLQLKAKIDTGVRLTLNATQVSVS